MKNEYTILAYKEALKAYKKEEIPVGCIIVKNNKIISSSHNNRQKKHNVLGHAEINAIIKAEKKLKDWRLDGCEMYVTLYPCNMCRMVIEESRLSKIFYLYDSDKKNNNNSNKYIKINNNEMLLKNYKNLVDNFFKNLRK